MRNERLQSTLIRAGTGPEELARAAEVDVKTVKRWLAGRTPHPRHRRAVAAHLGPEESYIWPHAADWRLGQDAQAELVTMYPHRSAVPAELWLDLLSRASSSVDVLAYAALFLPELDPGLVDTLAARAKEGATVRV